MTVQSTVDQHLFTDDNSSMVSPGRGYQPSGFYELSLLRVDVVDSCVLKAVAEAVRLLFNLEFLLPAVNDDFGLLVRKSDMVIPAFKSFLASLL